MVSYSIWKGTMFRGPLVLPMRSDRRRFGRYPLRLDVQYEILLNAGRVRRTGSGRTLNISRHGMLFESDRPMPERGEIALEVGWPCLLDGIHRLKIIIQGKIVRSNGTTTAVRFGSYDFRTCRRSPK